MAAPVLVQSKASGLNSSSPTVLAFTAPVTAGNLIIVKIVANPSVSGFSDTAGNPFLSQSFSTAIGWTLYIYYCLSAIGGPESITASGGGGFALMTIEEWSAGANASFTGIEGPIIGANGNSSTMNAGSITITNPTDVIAGVGLTQSSPTTAGPGFTKVGQIGLIGLEDGISEYEITASAGTYSVTATSGAANNFGMAGMAFMAVANPAPPAPSGPPGAAGYVLGTPFITTLRLALLTIWSKWPYRLIQDYNGNLYTAQQLLNNQNAGTRALMQEMVQYMPENGAIVWVSQGVRQATLYTVTQKTRNPMVMVL